MNNTFVIKVMQNFGTTKSWYYYTGSTYIVQGEVYGSFTSEICDSKEYTSENRAKNAMKKLKEKVWNWDQMKVVPKNDSYPFFNF